MVCGPESHVLQVTPLAVINQPIALWYARTSSGSGPFAVMAISWSPPVDVALVEKQSQVFSAFPVKVNATPDGCTLTVTFTVIEEFLVWLIGLFTGGLRTHSGEEYRVPSGHFLNNP